MKKKRKPCFSLKENHTKGCQIQLFFLGGGGRVGGIGWWCVFHTALLNWFPVVNPADVAEEVPAVPSQTLGNAQALQFLAAGDSAPLELWSVHLHKLKSLIPGLLFQPSAWQSKAWIIFQSQMKKTQNNTTFKHIQMLLFMTRKCKNLAAIAEIIDHTWMKN